jgi:hypothetical protein
MIKCRLCGKENLIARELEKREHGDGYVFIHLGCAGIVDGVPPAFSPWVQDEHPLVYGEGEPFGPTGPGGPLMIMLSDADIEELSKFRGQEVPLRTHFQR